VPRLYGYNKHRPDALTFSVRYCRRNCSLPRDGFHLDEGMFELNCLMWKRRVILPTWMNNNSDISPTIDQYSVEIRTSMTERNAIMSSWVVFSLSTCCHRGNPYQQIVLRADSFYSMGLNYYCSGESIDTTQRRNRVWCTSVYIQTSWWHAPFRLCNLNVVSLRLNVLDFSLLTFFLRW